MANYVNRWMLIRNPTIFNIITLARWVGGTNDSWTKHLMIQALFFFIISHRLRALKTLYFYFCKFIKKINKRFLKIILQEIMKKK